MPLARATQPSPRAADKLEMSTDVTAAQAYIDFTAATFDRVVTTTVSPLREPIATDPAEALRIIGTVADTITGFAIGGAAAELVRSVRRWFGVDGRVITAALYAKRRSRPRLHTAPRARFIADADRRPLVDELGRRLQQQLRLATIEVRELVAATVELVSGDVAMFDRLIADSLLAEQLAAVIVAGWCHASAAIAHKPLPELAGTPRTRALWRAWAEAAGLATPTSLDLDGAILRIF